MAEQSLLGGACCQWANKLSAGVRNWDRKMRQITQLWTPATLDEKCRAATLLY